MNDRKKDLRENEIFLASHRIILFSYTLFTVILIGETLVMGWEKWAIMLMGAGLALSWMLHIQQRINEYSRLWVYSILMIAAFFFYGVHETSTFDIAIVIIVVMMIFTMTGVKALISLCMFSFYFSFGYEIVCMLINGTHFDALVITRSLLHVAMVTMAAWISKTLIDNWDVVLGRSREEINELKEATERLDNFLANVSHEIRTPVNAVMGITSVLQKEDIPHQLKEKIRSIFYAGARVSEQIGDILDFTEIDMDRLSVTNESYMISSLINDFLVQMNSTENYGLDLVIDMEAGIPSELIGDANKIKKILRNLITNGYKFTREGGVYTHIYPIKRDYGINLVIEVVDTGVGMTEDEIEHIYEKFYQADSGRTRNVGGLGLGLPIVSGFTKAMGGVLTILSKPGEGTTVRVSIPQKVDNEAPCLSVRDKENCIAAGYLGFMTTGNPKIREFYIDMIAHLSSGLSVPFFRAQSRNDLEKLLASVNVTHLFVGTGEYFDNREYIDALAGEMNVAIVVDRGFKGSFGSNVTLLPKPFYGAQVANFLNHSFGNHEEDNEESMSCPGIRVLVVDDEPMNISVAKGIFESYGMIVSSALSGDEAIGICDKQDFDVIFMDHMMPGMDGVETAKRLRIAADRNNKELCIVALTANATSSAKEMFLSEGFDGFIPKPVDIMDLERVLKRILPKSAIVYKKKTDNTKPPVTVKGSIEDRLTRLVDLGVDLKQGLKYSQNDEAFYLKLLSEYASNRVKKTEDLNDLYKAGNYRDYAIKVHAIKSTSKMIGANELSDIAKLLEDAAKKENKMILKLNHPLLVPKYAELMDAISKTEGVGKEDIRSDVEPQNFDVMEFEPSDNGIGKGGEA